MKNNTIKNIFFILAITPIAFFTSFFISTYGFNLSDASLVYEAGSKFNSGLFPYRDFIYNLGFIPVILEGISQKIFGEPYLSSIYLCTIFKTLTVIFFSLSIKKYTNYKIAFFSACILSIIQNYVYHNGTIEVNFLISISIFLLSQYISTKNKVLLFLIGTTLSCILFSRQSSGIVCSGLFFLVLLIHDIKNKSNRMFLPTLLGFTTASLLFSIFLFANNLLEIGLKQMFIDAQEKKCIDGIHSILDMILGGITEIGQPPDLAKTILINNLIPFCICTFLIYKLHNLIENKKDVSEFIAKAGIIETSIISSLFGFYLLSHTKNINNIFMGIYCFAISLIIILLKKRLSKSILEPTLIKKIEKNNFIELSICIIPLLTFIGYFISGFTKDGLEPFLLTYDLPRVFFTTLFTYAIIFQTKSNETFGIKSYFLLLIISLCLGNTWARELSHPQRGWIDTSTLYPLCLLICAITNKISISKKVLFSKTLGILVLTPFIYQISTQKFIVGGEGVGLYDGTIRENRFYTQNPLLKNIKISYSKKIGLNFLEKNIHKNETCFIYGSAPALYKILECHNPTKLNCTYPDYFTAYDLKEVKTTLLNNPPKWIIHTGNRIGFPSLEKNEKINFGDYNQTTAKELNSFMKILSQSYTLIGEVKDFLPANYKSHYLDRDKIENLRLYGIRKASSHTSRKKKIKLNQLSYPNNI